MEKNWMELLGQKNQVATLMKTNECSEKYGLTLNQEDAELLAVERKCSLKEQRRVEFGSGIMPKLIYAFCDSAYIRQDIYTETLVQLQDIFYLFKNEVLDEITDDELIHFMKEQYEKICFGDLDYLSGTCLENFAQAIRAGYHDHQETQGYSAYHTLDEVPRWDYELYVQALQES